VSGTHVRPVVTTFGSGLLGLAAHGDLAETRRNSTPDRGFPPTLRLIAGGLLCEKCFDEDAIILRGPATPFGGHVDVSERNTSIVPGAWTEYIFNIYKDCHSD
jgi:hypothetical protein